MKEREIKELFEGVKSDLLTEDFKFKVATLIDAKVKELTEAKINEVEKHAESFKKAEAKKLEEKAVTFVDEVLVERLNQYLDYVAEEYVKENKLAVENGVKSMLYDKLATGVRTVLSENSIPEAKETELNEVVSKASELESEVKELNEKLLEAKNEIKGQQAIAIFESATFGLPYSEKEEIKKLAADFDIDNLKEFKSKIDILTERAKRKKGKKAGSSSEEKKKESSSSSEEKKSKKGLKESFEGENSDETIEAARPIKLKTEGENAAYSGIGDMGSYL
jgi:uncharacterized phage infection (PIP) family protein YhgE